VEGGSHQISGKLKHCICSKRISITAAAAETIFDIEGKFLPPDANCLGKSYSHKTDID